MIYDESLVFQRMIAFLENDTEETVIEIDAKSEEDCYLRKGQLLANGKDEIDKQFKLKKEKLLAKMQGAKSQLQIAAQLKKLQLQFKWLAVIEHDVRTILQDFCRKSTKYPKLLRNLALQALFLILERKVILRAKKRDVPLLKAMIPDLVCHYQEVTKRKIFLGIDMEQFLPSEAMGGVMAFTIDKKICVTNTVQTRFADILSKRLPNLKRQLFTSKEVIEK